MNKGFENWDVLHERKYLSWPASECRHEVELKAAISFVLVSSLGIKSYPFSHSPTIQLYVIYNFNPNFMSLTISGQKKKSEFWFCEKLQTLTSKKNQGLDPSGKVKILFFFMIVMFYKHHLKYLTYF